jgi:Flp pilus assembly protein TadB
MEKNLDEELKMAEIRKIEQMIAESFATVEKMREDSRRADKKWEEEREQRKLENERYQKQQEEEREKRKKEDERWRLEYERIQKESAARIAKYEAEREKLNKDTRYYPLITVIIATVAALGTILSPILRHYFPG